MSRKSLETILHYILNEADEAELEVIEKALERRKQDATRFAALGGFNPGAMAQRMSNSINMSLDESLASIRKTVRNYVEEIIRKNAPEITEEELSVLLDHYVGQAEAEFKKRNGFKHDGQTQADGEAAHGKGVVDYDAQKTGLPPEAMLSMIRDFVEYSTGAMPPSKQKELWDWMTNWKDNYWKAFPDNIKALIKALLEGRLGADEFWRAVMSILGL